MAACQGEPEEDLEHGLIFLKLSRGESQGSEDPYIGTVSIQVTLLYLECIVSFYNQNPDYDQYGPKGAPVFGTLEDGGEGWKDRLCDTDEPGAVDCTVQSFRQELDMTNQLTVVYDVESDDIEERVLPFGPLPTASLAQCEGGGEPTVRVKNGTAVRGLDGNGDALWNTESFNPPQAATNQGGKIKISAARTGT